MKINPYYIDNSRYAWSNVSRRVVQNLRYRKKSGVTELKQALKTANSRIGRLQKQGKGATGAIQKLYSAVGNQGVLTASGRFSFSQSAMSNWSANFASSIFKFLSSESSTLSGIHNINTRRANTLNARLNTNFTTEEWEDLFSSDDFKSIFYRYYGEADDILSDLNSVDDRQQRQDYIDALTGANERYNAARFGTYHELSQVFGAGIL